MREFFFTLWENSARKLLILLESDFHFMREPTEGVSRLNLNFRQANASNLHFWQTDGSNFTKSTFLLSLKIELFIINAANSCFQSRQTNE